MSYLNKTSPVNYLVFAIIIGALLLTNLYQVHISEAKGFSIKNIAMYIASIVLLTRTLGQSGVFQRIPAIRPLFLILLFAALSLSYAPFLASGAYIERMFTLVKFKNELFDPFLLYVIGFLLVTSTSGGLNLIKAYAVIFGILNILALSFFITGVNPFSVSVVSHHGTRFASFGGIANQGAYALILLIPIYYYLFDKSKNFSSRALYLSLLMINILSIGFTGSRGGMLLLLIVLAWLAVATGRVRFFLLVFSAAVIGLILYAMLFNIDFLIHAVDRMALLTGQDKLSVIQKSRDYTELDQISAGRTFIWKGIIKTMLNDPVAIVIGKGWGTFKAHMAHTIGIPAAAHNMVLKFLLELGLIGTTLFLAAGRQYYKFIKRIAKVDMLLKQCLMICFFVVVWTFMLSTPIELYSIWAIGFGLLSGYATLLMRINMQNRRNNPGLYGKKIASPSIGNTHGKA